MLLRDEPGTRTGRRKARRRRRAYIFAALLVLAGGVSGAYMLPHRSAPARSGTTLPIIHTQRSVLLAMTRHSDPSQTADSLTLFVSDPSSSAPIAVFIPVGTLTPIPGQGFDAIGKALSFGDPELVRLTAENLLGITIDRSVAIDDRSMTAMLDAVGGVDVDVTERLYRTNDDGTESLAFPQGETHLDAARAIEYLTMRSGTELDRFVRAHKVFEAIFASGAQRVDAAMKILPPLDAGSLASVWDLFTAGKARRFEVMPADPVGAGPDEVYRPDASKIDEMVLRDFAPSLPVAGIAPSARPRLELRNGNGRPESGVRAAARLIPAGFRIEVAGNASSFGNVETRVIVYGDDVRSADLGARIAKALGTGRVASGARGQTIVDATIVLGQDF